MHKNNKRIPIRFKQLWCSYLLTFFLLLNFALTVNKCFGQTVNGAKIFHFTSSYTCFPETKRLNGYNYDGQLYDFSNHYNDSSVLLVVPDKLRNEKDKVDIIFWFHGWRNNIDTALSYYHLASQFIASNRNAVLVLAEAAKNAPDSYGGKLEQPGVFKNLLEDVLTDLQRNKIISRTGKAGNIILAGHSGAYRVMAYILQNGGMEVREVDLFDALYSETDKFMQWIKKDSLNKFIDIYTDSGGTKNVSEQMMSELKKQNVSFLTGEEKNIDQRLLSAARIIFIHTTREHNDIIFTPDNFQLFLQSSPFLVGRHY